MTKACPACGRTAFTDDEREKMAPVLVDIARRRVSIPASEVGFSFTISDEAAKEIDRIIREQQGAKRSVRGFVWGAPCPA